VRWVVFSAAGERGAEARASAGAFLDGAARMEVQLHEFRDGFFPYEGGPIKERFEAIKDFDPDLVFTHTRDDRHQDHRLVNELTWNTFRDHLILEYEIPKYDGDLGAPNVFALVQEDEATRKVDLIEHHFATQRDKHWFSRENLLALMRLRAVECRSPSGFAEAFHGHKVVW
jgi:LmbE family N-acetylglucosaminyl deacetylase